MEHYRIERADDLNKYLAAGWKMLGEPIGTNSNNCYVWQTLVDSYINQKCKALYGFERESKLLEEADILSLEARVNQEIENGWLPYSGVIIVSFYCGAYFFQLMVK